MTKNTTDEKPAPTIAIDDGQECAELAALLGAEIASRFGPRDERPLSICARNAAGALVGGLNGASHWRWLYVRHLWVAQAARGRGLGRRLLGEAERVAQARGCVGVYVDTFDPRAAAFYEGCGFARVGDIANFPPGHGRIFLSKSLA